MDGHVYESSMMAAFKFSSIPLRGSRFSRTIRRHPTWFGIPFILLIVGASFGLQSFTQTRYDLRDQHVTAVRQATFCSKTMFLSWVHLGF
jgi:hypothetical protein